MECFVNLEVPSHVDLDPVALREARARARIPAHKKKKTTSLNTGIERFRGKNIDRNYFCYDHVWPPVEERI